FYYGDHGGVLPGSKGFVYETGLHVPLVVYIPPKYKHLAEAEIGSKNGGFVSFVDFGATVLNLAGVEIPKEMDGKPFLGKNIKAEEVESRDETYSYADRHDEKYDMVRAVRKGKYKYIRNYQPFNYDGLRNNYRYKQLAYREWLTMYENGELNDTQAQFFRSREPESLFDVEADPYETKNLANDPDYADLLKETRGKLFDWEKQLPDLSFYPEFYLLKNAFDNPVQFGQLHKSEIQSYIDVANLGILNFDEAKTKIEASLKSDDPWVRYWGLIVCSTFGDKAREFESIAMHIAGNDSEIINKVRAAEFLGIIQAINPAEIMIKALNASQDGAEAALILNSIVLMRDGEFKYPFEIEVENISQTVLEHPYVKRRLEYLLM
ncbi:MAG: sulfatase-like hydrolase/transferase, partial [Cyclobacteriaceae bacterium]|nr:sulfatase-like hydrolase/transferase [Cyclobacteriaceae bacterium]